MNPELFRRTADSRTVSPRLSDRLQGLGLRPVEQVIGGGFPSRLA